MTMLAPRSFLFSSTKPSAAPPSAQPPKQDPPPPTTRTEQQEVVTLGRGPTETPPASSVSARVRTNPSNPVVIPIRQVKDTSQRNHGAKGRRHDSGKASQHTSRDQKPRRQASAAVTSLLADTAIPLPRPRTVTRRQKTETQRLTLDAIFDDANDSENEYRPTLGTNPLDILLCPPEDAADSDPLGSDVESQLSYVSKMTTSTDSAPSLTDNSIGTSASMGSSVSPQSRGKRFMPTRNLEPLSLGDIPTDHPLSEPEADAWELDFRVFGDGNRSPQGPGNKPVLRQKSAFKSNLTSSLRALRSAAKSISNITAPMIAPDDFLTRSIIAIDPKVPFTDERMPPRLDDMPTPELRRYLNPTTNAPAEAHIYTSRSQTTRTQCTASIQMETYKISKPDRAKMDIRYATDKRANTSSPGVLNEEAVGPVARQRDMRENSDFIRMAVMEMRMRKNGKLTENAPGRARWALPPRRVSTSVYEIGEGGVPVRWIAITATG